MSDPRVLVVVAGAGRSGTSLLAGSLGRLGLRVPQPEVVADDTNPRGFGEPRWVVDFHNALLRRAAVHVSDARPAAWALTDAAADEEPTLDQLTAWLDEQYQLADRLVVKDPRISWFLRPWLTAARRCSARATVVTMLRPPAEVVGSRARYYGTRFADANLLGAWVNMMVQTERHTRGLDRAFVRYHDLLDPETEVLTRLGETLALPWLAAPDDSAAAAARALIDPGLRRVTTDWSDLAAPTELVDVARTLWQLLDRLAEPDPVAQSAEFDQVAADYAAIYEQAEALAMSSIDAAARLARREGRRKRTRQDTPRRAPAAPVRPTSPPAKPTRAATASIAPVIGRIRRGLRVAGTVGGRTHQPRLSIVVPIYNVAAYLPDCLASVLAQPFDDIEVVVVDDGSTDRSAAIARRVADGDSRVRVVSRRNGGLGAARNTGVEQCRGELLTFLDGDDVLPADAYTRMVSVLDDTGSDLVIGALDRQKAGTQTRLPRMARNHEVDRFGVTVEEMPLILADVFAVNKVFRRDFWDGEGLRFPVGVRYEDQPTLTRALFAARRFDVLADTVYVWLIREDGSSITQQRHRLADLEDRLLTKRWSTRTVVERGSPTVQRVWYADVLPVDMWEYFRAVPECSDDYWAALRNGVRELWNDSTVRFWETELPPRQRRMGRMVVEDRREELVRFLKDAGR